MIHVSPNGHFIANEVLSYCETRAIKDSYLEELTERTVEFEAETQTDFLLDRDSTI